MKINNLKNFTKGWFVGNFNPSLLLTDDFEVAIKRYNKNDYEESHFHKIAKEITVIVDGKVKMNGVTYKKNDIIIIEPNEVTDFLSLTNSTTLVIKTPSITGDKYKNYE